MFLLRSRMFSPSRAETGEAGVARHDVLVPPSTTSSLSGGIKGTQVDRLFSNNKAMDVKPQVSPSGFQLWCSRHAGRSSRGDDRNDRISRRRRNSV